MLLSKAPVWSAIFPTRPAFLCGAVRVRVLGSEGGGGGNEGQDSGIKFYK